MRDEPCVDPRIVAHFGQRGGYHNSFEVIDDEALNALVSQDLAGTAHL
jgi:hypothetical protein